LKLSLEYHRYESAQKPKRDECRSGDDGAYHRCTITPNIEKSKGGHTDSQHASERENGSKECDEGSSFVCCPDEVVEVSIRLAQEIGKLFLGNLRTWQ
jgi:hypothetical protein